MIQPWTQPFRAMPGSATPELDLYTHLEIFKMNEEVIDYLYLQLATFYLFKGYSIHS